MDANQYLYSLELDGAAWWPAGESRFEWCKIPNAQGAYALRDRLNPAAPPLRGHTTDFLSAGLCIYP
ncbi:hypothetical protein [Nonomuraea ceibae]|uniref:hypothetical protein n=1 Tax=Nonomuraea ceibae TaxID=1935170 RepID=UPI001C5E1F0B|nr:hypothetical protein [Nonomuraea ceibae]